jgi:hypothetical protein
MRSCPAKWGRMVALYKGPRSKYQELHSVSDIVLLHFNQIMEFLECLNVISRYHVSRNPPCWRRTDMRGNWQKDGQNGGMAKLMCSVSDCANSPGKVLDLIRPCTFYLVKRCFCSLGYPHRPWGSHSFLYNGYRLFFLGVMRSERDVDHSPLPVAKFNLLRP